MKNSEQPAFACASDGGHQPGLTKREYFAANAPEVPDWFKAMLPAAPPEPEEHWKNGNGYAAYWEKMNGDNESKRVIRFFQWRRFYADSMLAELEKTEGKP